MMYWDQLLQEVVDKDRKRPHYFSLKETPSKPKAGEKTARQTCLNKTTIKFYGEHRRDVMFSSREIDCLKYIIQGWTLRQIAKLFSLSVRTIEFYFCNIKNKMRCKTKFEVIQKLFKSDFMQTLMIAS